MMKKSDEICQSKKPCVSEVFMKNILVDLKVYGKA